jgi:uncharacterized protein YjdB
MACPDPNGGNDGDDTEDTPVTSVSVARPGSGTITAPIDPLYKGQSIALVATVRPASANQNVTWSSSDTGIAAVDANGTVTGVAIGDAVITATSVGKKADGNSATYTVTFKVKEDPNNITPELRIFNIAGAGEGSTSAVPSFDSNGRLTISNTSTAKGWGTTYDLVKGNTILYWSVPQAAPFSISARIKIKELASGIAEGSLENGFFIGAFSDPLEPVTEETPLYLAGLNTSSNGRRSVYATRLSSNKYDNSATGSTQFTDRITKEFVFQVSRTDTVYNLNIKDDAQTGSPSISPYTEAGINRGANSTPETEVHPVLSGSQPDQFGNRPLYLGIIICGATVEISSIKIEGNGTNLYPSSPAAQPTPIPAASSVTITNTENTVSVGAALGMTASVSPSEAIQTVTWSIEPANEAVATINADSGVVSGVSAGTVTVFATSVSTPTVKSTGFLVQVTAEQEVLENNRSWDFTTVPAGWTTGTETTAETYYNQGMTLLGTYRANGIRINITQAPPEGSGFSAGALQPNGTPPATATNGNPFARIAEVQGPFDITLKYWPNSSGSTDRSPSIRIKNSTDADYGAWITATTPSGNVGQTFTHSYTGTGKVTVELGSPAGRHPGTIQDIIITYTGTP